MMTRVHSDMRVKYARSGFTLMEILIAILIVGIVGAMAIPAFFNIYKKTFRPTHLLVLFLNMDLPIFSSHVHHQILAL